MKEGQKGYFYNFTSKIAFKKKKKKPQVSKSFIIISVDSLLF